MRLLNTSLKLSRYLCQATKIKEDFVRNMALKQNKSFINGVWCDAVSKQTFEVYNPANDAVVGVVPDMDEQDMVHAIDSAYSAFYSAEWQNKSAKERSQFLKVSNLHTNVLICIFYELLLHKLDLKINISIELVRSS